MADHVVGKRSPVTCQLKCANACLAPIPNTSDNSTFRDIAGAALSRRSVLGLAGASAITVAAAMAGPAAAATPPGRQAGRGLAFGPIEPVAKTVDSLTVPAGWQWEPIIRWGDPVVAGAPEFDPANQSAAAQATQFGYNNDYTDIITTDRRRREGLLVCNHEYVNPAIMYPPTMPVAEQRAVSLAAHGFSVVELERDRAGKPWRTKDVRKARRNRRITGNTPFDLDGPAAGSALLRTKGDPTGTRALGTLGNCSGGTTPWGTVLSGEENFNGYFRADGTSAEEKRYGLASAPSSYGFETIDPRFDARSGTGYENEPNRFGWVVEIDPYDPHSTPVKHTALGRLKHEGANVILSRAGKAVTYMGDDERFDYLYKFVSDGTYRPGNGRGAREHNKTLLSRGDLYVARFSGDSPASEIDGTGKLPADGKFDGSGEWIALTRNGRSAVPGMSIEEVLVHTRLAADKVGATKMDRCEDVQPSPHTGKVYVVCTNNTDRGKAGKEGATEPNPRNANKHGHIVELTELGDQTSTRFAWNLVLVAGDPAAADTYFAGYPKDKVSPISCPDNVAFDSKGDLWIATDGMPSAIGFSDGLFRMPLSGKERGHVEQFLAVPQDAETCGPVVHDKDGLVFVAVQHPGEEGTWAEQRSYFPDYVSGQAGAGEWKGPRPSIVQAYNA
ncbi:MAG TPA: PhoX family phosphatase [Flexivirga sp.]|uniref:PhoX family protein n=1 Tax=Flexivirga sp. TaxID=1962927 RepID=UPI002B59AA8E|nr:PhoX family phosphatase [Flexivirga sp.]HWC23076.1 PhoX family phosphatase [Flexivirga sp.]